MVKTNVSTTLPSNYISIKAANEPASVRCHTINLPQVILLGCPTHQITRYLPAHSLLQVVPLHLADLTLHHYVLLHH